MKNQPKQPMTAEQQAQLNLGIAQYELQRAERRIVESAEQTIKRLEYAIRDIQEAINNAASSDADAPTTATADQLDRERANRLARLATVCTESVLSQVSNMGLHGAPRDLVAVEVALLNLVKVRAEQAS